MATITETMSRVTRITVQPPPTVTCTSNDGSDEESKRVVASLGVGNVASVRRLDGTKHGSGPGSLAGLAYHDADDRNLATLEVRCGAPPLLLRGSERKLVEPKTARGWRRLDRALFGTSPAVSRSVAWLHQPFPPLVGEVPTLLLEALARICGCAGGMDDVLGAPLRLTRGTFADGALTATIAQPCVCGGAEGDRHGGAALGAVLVLRKGLDGAGRALSVRCEHAEGCNTIPCSRATYTLKVTELLKRLHTAAAEHAAGKSLPELAAAEAVAITAGVEILDAAADLPAPRWPPRSFADKKKRQRVITCELDECFRAAGFKRARDDLGALQPMTAAEKRRKHWLSNYLQAVDASYNRSVDAEGLRWQQVAYGQRANSSGRGTARQEATNVRTLRYSDGKDIARVCLAGMPRELRPYACAGVGRDLDFKMCHPLIFSQVPAQLAWANGQAPPSVTEILKLCTDRGAGRDALFKELAIFHQLDADADRWSGYRKDVLKKLVTQLFYGGSYKSWIENTLLPPRDADDGTALPPVRAPSQEPRHERVKALEREVRALRDAIFTSEQWAPFVAEWRKLLHDEKGGDRGAIDRSIMSRIAQELEDRCLRAMVAQLGDDGWQVLALIYDGCVVRDRSGCAIDLARLEARVHQETGLRMIIEEKELFDAQPRLVLSRSFD